MRKASPPVRLVTAHDIARLRYRRTGDATVEASITRTLDYYRELMRAADEKARGEWRLPDAAR